MKRFILGLFTTLLMLCVGDARAAVIIRPIQREDWKSFRHIRLRALGENPKAYGIAEADEAECPEEQWQVMCQEAQEGKGKWYVVAEYDGELIGILGAFQTFGTYMRHLVEIVQAYVVPEFRRQGVMTHLFEALKKELQQVEHVEQMIVWVTLHEDQVSKNLWEKCGFTLAGTLSKVVKVEGRYYDCCWLETPLRN